MDRLYNNLIQQFRVYRNFTQEEVAREVGVTLRHYQRVEYGAVLPNIILGLKIARLLDVDPYKLFCIDYEPNGADEIKGQEDPPIWK